MNNTILFRVFSVFLLIFPLNAGQALAQSVINELRFGGSIIDVTSENKRDIYNYERAGFNAEVLFSPINIDFVGLSDVSDNQILSQFLNPRWHLGTTIALEEDTTSSIYTGLTWHFPVFQSLFFEGSFGAAAHNGEMKNKDIGGGKERRGMGSPILFRESLSVGLNVTEKVDLVLQLSHMSHAGLAGEYNAGQTDLALKLGWKF